MPDSGSFATTERTRVRRHPERAHYDRDTVHAILDAALMCHVGYVIDHLPYVTPTSGATASGFIGTARRRAACCAPSATASRSA